MKLVFASNNKHKLSEVQSCLGVYVEIISLADVWSDAVLLETANTFNGNARMKAEQVFRYTGWNCLSDDSGLEVDALNGRPGVFSARFAGENASDADNRNQLLLSMEGEANRSARFRTVICLCMAGSYTFFEGALEGHIALTASGQHGFGYDSLFIPYDDNRTLAEMSPSEKNAISHRSLALAKVACHLRNLV